MSQFVLHNPYYNVRILMANQYLFEYTSLERNSKIKNSSSGGNGEKMAEWSPIEWLGGFDQ